MIYAHTNYRQSNVDAKERYTKAMALIKPLIQTDEAARDLYARLAKARADLR